MTRAAANPALNRLAELVDVPANAGARAVISAFSERFAAMAERLEDGEIAMFDVVFMEIIRDSALDDKVLLAERFAPLMKAPPRLIGSLAEDEAIEVSGPVLRQSPRLGEPQLIDLARRKGEAHLKALASRRIVTPKLSEAIVARDVPNVMVVLIDNPGTNLDHATKASIIDSAFGHPGLFIAIDRHSDLGSAMMQGWDSRSKSTHPARDADALVAGYLGEGKIEEALAVIAMESQTRHRVVLRAYKQDTLESFVLIARAANLSWGTMIGLLLNQFGMSTSANMINESRRLFDDTTRREAMHKARVIAMADKALRG
ncbi:MAG: DUF2336 domain-containing protein [Bosea sp. (in: a-proteobacteria)]